jgi:hypothetical protein
MRIRTVFLAGICAGFSSMAATAQAIAPSISADLGMYYETLEGDDFPDAESSIGFDALLRYRSPTFSLGAGYMWVDHDRAEFSIDTRYLEGFVIEPRISTPKVNGIFSAYVMGRGARLWQDMTTDIDGITTDLESKGYSLGGGVGVSGQAFIWAFDISVYYSAIWFDEFTAPARDETLAGSSSQGSSLGVRLGAGFVVGPWLWSDD